jgi:hypothetical protein
MREWRSYALPEIFTFERGSRLINSDHVPGEIAYISSSGRDNGIAAYVSPPTGMRIYSNQFTIANSGTVGVVFYHPYTFVASDHCTVLGIRDKLETLDEDLFLFLRPVLELIRHRYNFGREINNRRLSREVLALPATEAGSPDWSYMRSYIQALREQVKFESIDSKAADSVNLNTGSWREYRIGDVFHSIKSGRCGNAQALLAEGNDLPYIGAKRNDYGVVRQVSYPHDERLVFDGPAFAFICDGQGSVGLTTFIPFEKFVGTTTVKFGYHPEVDHEVAAFMSTVIDMNRPRFSFGRKWGSRLEDTIIALPADPHGQPDFGFMRRYIRSLNYGNLIGQASN